MMHRCERGHQHGQESQAQVIAEGVETIEQLAFFRLMAAMRARILFQSARGCKAVREAT